MLRRSLRAAAAASTPVLLASCKKEDKSTALSHALARGFVADAISVSMPAVVNIAVGKVGQGPASGGSGFIMTADGLIVTNAHVVRRGRSVNADTLITVTTNAGQKFRAKVHSMDPLSDIALVQIEAPERLPVIELGTSSHLRAGEWVVALGSPLSLQNTATAGIVSAVARPSAELGLSRQRTEYIQTDAAINQGNSGGPLVNLDGEVIGINTMKAQQNGVSGIGFAIPIDTAAQVIAQLRSNRKVVRPYIGMKMVTLDETSAGISGSKAASKPEQGAVVVEVLPGSPAEKSGLQAGDIIIRFDGAPVLSTRDILGRVGFEVGRRVPLAVQRGGAELELGITTEAVGGAGAKE